MKTAGIKTFVHCRLPLLASIFLYVLLTVTIQNTFAALQMQETTLATKNTLYFFWGEGCPHCAAAKPFLDQLAKRHPDLKIQSYEVFSDETNLELLKKMTMSQQREPKGVPTFIYGEKIFEGFNETIAKAIEEAISANSTPPRSSGSKGKTSTGRNHGEKIPIPFFGTKDSRSLSLPVFTVVIAGLDSFNPCAFFILFTLLSLLVHAHSRKRMVLIGGIFILSSGFIYFLFMATWLNLFFVIGHLAAVTYVAGIFALTISVINIKDFFIFKKGISLSIPETSKPKLFEKMRLLIKKDSLPAALAGTIVLAVTANSYELLCTAGFPMVYTRVLTLSDLSTGRYYAFLAFYNLIYILPLAIIVAIFVATLGSRKLTERQGRVLKLVSGIMMLGLALALLIDPSLLQSPLAATSILAAALGLSAAIVFVTKKIGIPH